MRNPTWREAAGLARPHRELQANIVQYLTLMGWYMILTHDEHHPPVENGIPDLIAFKAGRVLFIEVKAGRDKKSWDQLRVESNLERAGFTVLEARRLEDVIVRVADCRKECGGKT